MLCDICADVIQDRHNLEFVERGHNSVFDSVFCELLCPESIVLLVFDELWKLECRAHVLLTQLIAHDGRLVKLLFVEFSILDFAENLKETLQECSSIEGKSEIFHLQESSEQVLQVRLLEFDSAERSSNLLNQLFADMRFFDSKCVLDAAKDSHIDDRFASQNLLQLLFICQLDVLVRFFVYSIFELWCSKLLVNQLDLF